MPEIEDGDGLIFDLTVINAYLEEAYPNPPLMLRGALERAQARQLENFCDEAVLVADLPALWVPYWSPPEQRDSAGMERGRALCPILSAPSARRSLCVVTSVWPM